MKPEEYFKQNYKNNSNGMLKPAKWVFEFAEAYHKHRVNQISYEEIERQCMSVYGYDVDLVKNAERDIKWLKQKLLEE